MKRLPRREVTVGFAGVEGAGATAFRVGGLIRCFPSVGPPPLFSWRANAGLSDTILSGLDWRGAGDGEPTRCYRAFMRLWAAGQWLEWLRVEG
jgi:hypothetical protein